MNQRLQQNQAQQSESVQQHGTTQRRDFAEAEDVLRADRELTQPPESLGSRLAESIAAEPPPVRKPWYKRLFD
jgi:hypothetical protein